MGLSKLLGSYPLDWKSLHTPEPQVADVPLRTTSYADWMVSFIPITVSVDSYPSSLFNRSLNVRLMMNLVVVMILPPLLSLKVFIVKL